MTVIKGKICKGYGWAYKCVPLQIRFFKDRLPEIASMFPKTLNVELENPVKFLKYDFVFPNVKWCEDYPPETFSIIRAELLPDAERYKKPVPCLLYFPSTSPHRANPFMLEIITKELDLTGVKECSVFFSQPSRTADWFFFGLTDGSPVI